MDDIGQFKDFMKKSLDDLNGDAVVHQGDLEFQPVGGGEEVLRRRGRQTA